MPDPPTSSQHHKLSEYFWKAAGPGLAPRFGATLIIAVTLPCLLFYTVRMTLLIEDPQLESYFDRRTLLWARDLMVVASVVSVVLLGAFQLAPRRYREAPRYGHALSVLAMVMWFGFSSIMAYMIGPFTTPIWGAFLIGGFAGFLMVGRTATLSGIVAGAFVLVSTTLAERAGMIPYAPLLAEPPIEAGAPTNEWVGWTSIITILSTIAILVVFEVLLTRWRVREEEVRKLASTDALTGLANRRHLLGGCGLALARTNERKEPLTLVLLDIDDFKNINDSYGHLSGDLVLAEVARRLTEGLPRRAVVGRYGGEEFGVVLPGVSLEEGLEIAEGRRLGVSATPITLDTGEQATITISLGIAASTREDRVDDVVELVRRADGALYTAKRNGKNRSWVFGDPEPVE